MDNSLISKNRARLDALLQNATTIGIVVGPEHQDVDKMAASLALYLSLAKSYSKASVQIISKKEPIVELSSLVGIDKVKKNFEGAAKTLTVSIPYKEGEIEKVSYNIEGDKLNINLFAMKDQGITFNEEDVNYIRKGATPDLLFAIGFETESELRESIGEIQVPVVAINKRNVNASYAEIAYIDDGFASNAEIVSELVKDLGLFANEDVAQNILDGVVYATRNFTAPVTSGFSFASAAFAMQVGAKRREARKDIDNTQQHRTRIPEEAELQPIKNEKRPDVVKSEESSEEVPQEKEASKKIPRDWFVPKVYKGAKDLEE